MTKENCLWFEVIPRQLRGTVDRYAETSKTFSMSNSEYKDVEICGTKEDFDNMANAFTDAAENQRKIRNNRIDDSQLSPKQQRLQRSRIKVRKSQRTANIRNLENIAKRFGAVNKKHTSRVIPYQKRIEFNRPRRPDYEKFVDDIKKSKVVVKAFRNSKSSCLTINELKAVVKDAEVFIGAYPSQRSLVEDTRRIFTQRGYISSSNKKFDDTIIPRGGGVVCVDFKNIELATGTEVEKSLIARIKNKPGGYSYYTKIADKFEREGRNVDAQKVSSTWGG